MPAYAILTSDLEEVLDNVIADTEADAMALALANAGYASLDEAAADEPDYWLGAEAWLESALSL